MNFLQASGNASMVGNVVMMVGMFAIVYFLMIRPQQKRQKEHAKMLAALGKGDRVITSGGIHGTIVGSKEDIVVIKIDENVKVEVSRANITDVVK
ncbi:MAG: preprotein translocase subunit YajC [bacterium]|nr:preprotein translocase subunit YajC [bacterium]